MDARRIAVVVSPGGDRSRGEAICKSLMRHGSRAHLVEASASLGADVGDVAFLAVATDAEAASVQRVLEAAKVSHTGPGVLASSVAADRAAARQRLRQHNLATPPGYVLTGRPLPSHDLGFPCVVKPAHGPGPSRLVHSEEELASVVAAAAEELLVERYVRGERVRVALVGTDVVGIHRGAARLSPTRLKNLSAMALAAARALDCRGTLQVDFVCPELGNEVVVDVRTAVDLAPQGDFVEVARAGGSSLDSLCQRLIARAIHPPQPAPGERHEGGVSGMVA